MLSQVPRGSYAVVDVRTPEEFAAGHVPGSVNVPLGALAAGASVPQAETLILCCRSGGRAGQALRLLEQRGVLGAVNGGGWEDVRDLLAGR